MTTGKERHGDADWPTITLGDCVEINYATYTPKEAWPFINYLDTKNITENRIAEIQHLIAGKDKFPTRARRRVQAGDIVYSTVRPDQRHFGIMKNVPENFLASTGFAVIKGKPETACTNFIYWFLAQDHIVERLHTVAEHSTSAYPSIKPADIERLTLKLPSLSEQRAIAGVLSALDDKIELDRRTNDTLDEMAQAVFEDWFLRFGPTRAKMEGREPYLPLELWPLFPDRLVDSELGMIPEGWGCRKVSDFADIKGGKQLPKDKFVENGPVPVLGGAGLMGYTDHHNADGYVISIGRVGEYCGQFFSHRGRAWVNNNASIITPRKDAPEEWLLLTLRNLNVDLIKKGAAQPFVSNSDLSCMGIISPGEAIVEAFSNLTKPLFFQSDRILSEIRALSDLRDALLPKLVAGEIRLDDATVQWEGATRPTR